jgi:hypothetical protein
MTSENKSTRRGRRGVGKGKGSDLLQHDVAAMIGDADTLYPEDREELARQIIVVVRERVLMEIESYARTHVR